jgi:hypothetical protein
MPGSRNCFRPIKLSGAIWTSIMGFPLDSLLRGLASRWIVSDSLDQADAIVVLGGGLDIRPSAAAELYKRGTAQQILVVKAETDKGREAGRMREKLSAQRSSSWRHLRLWYQIPQHVRGSSWSSSLGKNQRYKERGDPSRNFPDTSGAMDIQARACLCRRYTTSH